MQGNIAIMSLFTFAFIFVGSICLSLGLLHLLIFFRRKELKVDLFFSCVAFAIAFSSYFEIWAFKTGSLPEHVLLFKGTLAVQGFLWIFFAWFIHFHTRSKILWPPVFITILYGVVQIINVLSPGSILFHKIAELKTFTMQSGELLFFANGPANSLRGPLTVKNGGVTVYFSNSKPSSSMPTNSVSRYSHRRSTPQLSTCSRI